MTNFTTRMMIAAATVVVAAGAASAQTLKAEIPFTFRAGDTVMGAGTYHVERIRQDNGQPLFQLRDANHSILLMAVSASDAKKAWVAKSVPVLVFECGAARCSLAQIWTGDYGSPAYKMPHGKVDKNEPVHVAMVEMRPEKSE